MSLSSDVRDTVSKPHDSFSENHPLLLALGGMVGFIATLVVVTRLLIG